MRPIQGLALKGDRVRQKRAKGSAMIEMSLDAVDNATEERLKKVLEQHLSSCAEGMKCSLEVSVVLEALFPQVKPTEETVNKDGLQFGKQLVYLKLLLDELEKDGPIPGQVLWLLMHHKNYLQMILRWLVDEATFMTTNSRSVGLNIHKSRKSGHCPFCERG